MLDWNGVTFFDEDGCRDFAARPGAICWQVPVVSWQWCCRTLSHFRPCPIPQGPPQREPNRRPPGPKPCPPFPCPPDRDPCRPRPCPPWPCPPDRDPCRPEPCPPWPCPPDRDPCRPRPRPPFPGPPGPPCPPDTDVSDLDCRPFPPCPPRPELCQPRPAPPVETEIKCRFRLPVRGCIKAVCVDEGLLECCPDGCGGRVLMASLPVEVCYVDCCGVEQVFRHCCRQRICDDLPFSEGRLIPLAPPCWQFCRNCLSLSACVRICP